MLIKTKRSTLQNQPPKFVYVYQLIEMETIHSRLVTI